MQQPIYVPSEIGALQRVLIHRPDMGIDRVSPNRAEELLFDDIVHLPKMMEEHDIFTKVLRAFLGDENVLEIEQLLLEGLNNNEEKKAELLKNICDFEELPKRDRDLLYSLNNEELKDLLITGYCAKEDAIIFPPIPNFIFTRDIAVSVNDHVIVTKAAKEARFRENFITRFIFWAHPSFEYLTKENKLVNLNHVDIFPPSRKGEQVSIEGGDMMILNKDYLLIGTSERSTSYSVDLLKEILFEKGVVKNVAQVNIPVARSWMHIDTLFTQVNHNHMVAYKPLVVDGIGANVQVHRHTGTSKTYASIKEFIQMEINDKMEFILAGNGESPYQEREQWTDGCNLVTLRPGVAITYDRNPRTEIAFKDKGYSIVQAEDLLDRIEKGEIKVEDIQNTIICIPSGELSRARGGSHCMTCPIERGDL